MRSDVTSPWSPADLSALHVALDLLDPPDTGWRTLARPEQLPPGDWRRVFYLRGGRGSGKTWSASNTFAELIRAHPTDPDGNPSEWAVIAPTFADARDTCVENSRSGLLKALGLPRLYGGWNRSQGQLRLPSGQLVYVGGADDGALRVQGKNLSGCWSDELGLWKMWRVAWDESINYAVRIHPAKILATGTPKRGMPAMKLVRRLVDDPATVNRVLRTEDNRANLDAAALEALMALRGTTLGAQELEGAVLDDIEGALWTFDLIDGHRVPTAPELDRIVVAIDPAVTNTDGSDEHGLIVAGMAGRGPTAEFYVFRDASCRRSVQSVAELAVHLYRHYEADAIIAEVNNGGDWIGQVIRQAAGTEPVRYQTVRATRGKVMRAEPIASLYEQGRVHHVGMLGELETQMCEWTPDSDDSPDRVDALVWAVTALAGGSQGGRMRFAGRAA